MTNTNVFGPNLSKLLRGLFSGEGGGGREEGGGRGERGGRGEIPPLSETCWNYTKILKFDM